MNYDFGYYYDKDSLCDNFFPNLKESTNDKKFDKSFIMSGKVYFCFQIFNQMFEDYTTARYNYYRALHVKHKRIDSKVKYIYTFDYTQHSLKHGMLKSVFSSLYNCLDKIAHITKFYFSNSEIEFNNINIYFDWLTQQEFKQIIKENGNFQLLALYNLAVDFKNNGPNYGLNRIRNRITHSFLNINVEISFDEKYSDFEITEDILIDGINNLFYMRFILSSKKFHHNISFLSVSTSSRYFKFLESNKLLDNWSSNTSSLLSKKIIVEFSQKLKTKLLFN